MSSKVEAAHKSAPSRQVGVKALPLAKEQRHWYEKACAHLNEERLKRLLLTVTSIHSPTGGERALAEYLARHMKEAGFEAAYQPMDEDSGNAIGRLPGGGGGARLMLYDPIDTHIENERELEVPWIGPDFRDDMKPEGIVRDGLVVGLGASNPKGMAMTILEVAQAVCDAGVPLKGDLLVAFAGGGMPWHNSNRRNRGLSDGLYHLLTRGYFPDYAIVMKPWNVVFFEEPGLCWFKVSVKGVYGYAGIPHGVPGWDSSILPAASVIKELQAWLPTYVKNNTSGNIEPWGWISALRAGQPDKPAFPPAASEIYLDIRVNPRVTPADVAGQFGQAIDAIRKKYPDITLDWEMIASTPGGHTDPQNWIVQSAMRGWQEVEGRPHPEVPYMAGQTDGALMRRMGVPTARIGWPWPYENAPAELSSGLGGMGVTYLPDLLVCARKILYAVIDTCTRSREELGL